MTIYKHKETGVLYNLYWCRGIKIMGYWHEAVPYNREGKTLTSHRQLNKLEPVAYR